MQEKNFEILYLNEYEEFGDTRNRKGLIGYGYSKHNKGTKEQKRIYYTKMKKIAQSLIEQEKKRKSTPKIKENKSNKRILKQANIESKDYGNNVNIVIKKNKKIKFPKKDRIRF